MPRYLILFHGLSKTTQSVSTVSTQFSIAIIGSKLNTTFLVSRWIKPRLFKSPSDNKSKIFKSQLTKCNLRTVNSSIRTVSEIHVPYELCGPSKRYLPLFTRVKYVSPTNEMQFTDRELFYTDRVCGSRSVQTVRTVRKISRSHSENEIFKVPIMTCNLRTVNSSIRTVCVVHGPYKLYGP